MTTIIGIDFATHADRTTLVIRHSEVLVEIVPLRRNPIREAFDALVRAFARRLVAEAIAAVERKRVSQRAWLQDGPWRLPRPLRVGLWPRVLVPP